MSKTPLKYCLSGSTLIELLIVMIVSGILFLMLFDSLHIVHRFGNALTDKISRKSTLLYSHQLMEALFEKTDSIRKEDDKLLFYTYGSSQCSLTVDSLQLILSDKNGNDTLFVDLKGLSTHALEETSSLIDSIHIVTMLGTDTIKLDYGLSHYRVSLTEKIFNDGDID